MVTVTVLFKTPWTHNGQRKIELDNGATVMDLIRKSGLNEKQWKYLLVVSSGRKCLPEDVLEDGDSIVILPLICGG